MEKRCHFEYQCLDLAILSKRYGFWRYKAGIGNTHSEHSYRAIASVRNEFICEYL